MTELKKLLMEHNRIVLELVEYLFDKYNVESPDELEKLAKIEATVRVLKDEARDYDPIKAKR